MIKLTNLRKENQVPLFVEDYPADYNGYKFLTLIKYRDTENLVVVDNVTNKEIKAYVVDACAQNGINEEWFIEIVANWYEQSASSYPLSIEISKLGLNTQISKIFRIYNIDYITRVIGTLPSYEMTKVFFTKRKKRKILLVPTKQKL